jgi:anaerobic magnesium-protoporphyrin IX monomethyl ester cyclase
MDKGTRVEQIAAATRRLQAAGIRACWFLQFGYPGETFEDILATVALLRELRPDDVGVSVSYPLPGTRFFAMVQAELGEQTHWQDSSDLAMMFQGTYQTPFYRRLRELVHRDLEVRRAGRPEELATLEADWRHLTRLERSSRSALPTAVHKPAAELPAPDLSRTWN